VCNAEGVRKTLAQYAQWTDDRRVDDLAGLFTEDAEWTVMDETVTGREAIRAYIATWKPFEVQVKHVTVDSVIDIDGDTATAMSNFIVLYETPAGGVVHRAGRYEDRLRDEGDRWRISRRVNHSTSWVEGWKPPL
jgi:ketosteroid isomerase-like protein